MLPSVGASEAEERADSDERFLEAWEQFSRTLRRRRGREAQRGGGPGLSLAQYQLCEGLKDGPLPVGAAAVAAGIAAPTATRMIDLLVTQGAVERTADPGDKRVVIVSLTAAGRRALEQKSAEVAETRERIAAALSEDERAVAADILVRLANVVEEL